MKIENLRGDETRAHASWIIASVFETSENMHGAISYFLRSESGGP